MARWSMPRTFTIARPPPARGGIPHGSAAGGRWIATDALRRRQSGDRLRRRVSRRSVVAVDAFAALVPLLGLEAQRRDRPRVEAGQPDGLSGLFAIAVRVVLDPAQGLVDLGDELTLTVPRTKLKSAIGLGGRPVRQVPVILSFLLEMGQRLARLAEDVFFPRPKHLLEILKVTLVHELLVLGRTVVRTLSQNRGCFHENLTPPGTPETRAGCIAKRPMVSTSPKRRGLLSTATCRLQLRQLYRRTRLDLVQNRFQLRVLGR